MIACLHRHVFPPLHGLRAASKAWNSLIYSSPYVPLSVDLGRPAGDDADLIKLCMFLARWKGPMDASCDGLDRDKKVGARLRALLESARGLRLRTLVIENHEENIAKGLGEALGKLAELEVLCLEGKQKTSVLASCLPKLPRLRRLFLNKLGESMRPYSLKA
jgi:hypothetical protein